MTNRQRLSAILAGDSPDRIPWIPRIDIWYNSMVRKGTLPLEFKGKSLNDIQAALNIGDPARGGSVYNVSYTGIDHEVYQNGDQHISEFHTPIGDLREITILTREHLDNGVSGTKTEHLLKDASDYRIWEYIAERTEYVPTYSEYVDYDAAVDSNGLPIVRCTESPCYHFLQDLAGFKSAYFQIVDYPDEVAHLFRTMEDVFRDKAWPVIAESPAELILTGAHLSTQLTPPGLFKKFVLPYTSSLNHFLQESGKKTALHADDDTKAILQLIEEARFDMVECFVTAPMVPTTLNDAKKAWSDRIVIWGGIPASIIEPSYPLRFFKDFVRNLFKVIAPGNAFILGVADNVMPTSDIDRLKWIGDYVESSGAFPLSR